MGCLEKNLTQLDFNRDIVKKKKKKKKKKKNAN